MKPRAFDHDAALLLWQHGLKHRAIAERVRAKPATVLTMVRDARNRGDRRASRRYLPFLPMPAEREKQ